MEDPSFTSVMDEMENPILYLGPEAYEKAWTASNIEEKERARKFLIK
jgi:hypothetical protein